MNVIHCPWCGNLYLKSQLRMVLVKYPLFGPGSIWSMDENKKNDIRPDLDFYCPECIRRVSRVWTPLETFNISMADWEDANGVMAK